MCEAEPNPSVTFKKAILRDPKPLDPATGRHNEGGQECLEEWRQSAQAILWADFVDVPVEEEARLLTEYFGIHVLVMQDAQREQHPPKFEGFQDHSFILLKGLDAATTDLEFGTS